MLMGQSEHAIDKKNRLFLPTKMRTQIIDKRKELVLTCGFENCLFLYSHKQWGHITLKLRDTLGSSGDPKQHRAFMRMFLSGAVHLSLDSHGRILIPQMHVEHAQLTRDVVIIGVIDRIEVWSKKLWDSYRNKAAHAFDSAARNIFDL